MNDENKEVYVPYIVHEGVQVRLERTIKRLVCALILTILLMFATNALWIWSWMQYDYVSEDSTTTTHTTTNTVDVDGHNGTATYIGDIVNGKDNRDIDNGDDDSETQAETENKEEWTKQRNP